MDNDIRVYVKTNFLEQHSINEGKYIFTYTVDIVNNSASDAKLLSRHWLITDCNGKVIEVIGDGVIGKQPLIKINNSYQYNSFVVLETNSGMMSGYYIMEKPNQEKITVIIPPFHLITKVNIIAKS